MADRRFEEDYEVPFERRADRFQEQLNPASCAQLRSEGFVVIDNFLGQGWSRALLQETRWLHKNG